MVSTPDPLPTEAKQAGTLSGASPAGTLELPDWPTPPKQRRLRRPGSCGARPQALAKGGRTEATAGRGNGQATMRQYLPDSPQGPDWNRPYLSNFA